MLRKAQAFRTNLPTASQTPSNASSGSERRLVPRCHLQHLRDRCPAHHRTGPALRLGALGRDRAARAVTGHQRSQQRSGHERVHHADWTPLSNSPHIIDQAIRSASWGRPDAHRAGARRQDSPASRHLAPPSDRIRMMTMRMVFMGHLIRWCRWRWPDALPAARGWQVQSGLISVIFTPSTVAPAIRPDWPQVTTTTGCCRVELVMLPPTPKSAATAVTPTLASKPGSRGRCRAPPGC